MKEIMMTIHTSAEGDAAVTVNAKFDSHAAAVRFHEGLAALVKLHSPGHSTMQRPWRLLAGGKE